jgi:hypothetical protein
MDAAIEQLAKHFNDLEANAAEAERQHVCAQQHHCANFRLRQRLTDSTGVASNKIELKIAQRLTRNTNVREFAKPSRYAVNDRITRNDLFDNLTRRQSTRLCERRNLNLLPVERHSGDVGECQCLAV